MRINHVRGHDALQLFGQYFEWHQIGENRLFATLILVFASNSIPDGIAAYTVMLCVFMLANFAVVLCGALHAQSEALTSAVIIVTNMGVSIFMFTVAPLPGIADHMWAAAPAWNSTFWTVLGCELAVLVLAFALPFFFAARRRDFI